MVAEGPAKAPTGLSGVQVRVLSPPPYGSVAYVVGAPV